MTAFVAKSSRRLPARSHCSLWTRRTVFRIGAIRWTSGLITVFLNVSSATFRRTSASWRLPRRRITALWHDLERVLGPNLEVSVVT